MGKEGCVIGDRVGENPREIHRAERAPVDLVGFEPDQGPRIKFMLVSKLRPTSAGDPCAISSPSADRKYSSVHRRVALRIRSAV